jgi:HEAT repeat protein
MSACPNCGKPVDALRSRHVGVRAGKVVAYCSAECLAAQETRPTAIPKGITPSVETGPVIEIVKAPATGPVKIEKPEPVATKKKKPKTEPVPVQAAPEPAPPTTPAKVAAEPAKRDSEPAAEWAKNAEMMKQGDATRADRPRRGLVTAVFVVVVAAVAALVAYKFIFVKKATSATSTAQPAPPSSVAKVEPSPVVAPEPPKPPAITIPEALDKAKAAIAKNLRADSPRVQRLAAGALERGGDRASAELLVAALKNETSDLAKLELAYALARGGDARGMSVLGQALISTPADPRRWAAERLVRLAIGEPEKKPEIAKAADVLAASLEVPQNRLVSGELLARLGDPRGLKALDAIRADAQASPEAKAAAVIALGLAGRTDVAPALHELLGSGNARPLAAAALAHLHDATARPVLVEQLEAVGQRVRAARALRELDPALDPLPLLPPLLAAIASATNAEQVEAGEAMLVLCGPAAWSARE